MKHFMKLKKSISQFYLLTQIAALVAKSCQSVTLRMEPPPTHSAPVPSLLWGVSLGSAIKRDKNISQKIVKTCSKGDKEERMFAEVARPEAKSERREAS